MAYLAGINTAAPGRADPAARAGRAGTPGVSFALPPVPSASGGAAGIGAAGPVQAAGMLALQEWQSDGARDREARRRGDALLAALARLQRALLGGGAAEEMERMSALLEDMPEAADPGLAALLRAVALRARVEIARRDNGSATC